ncbi:MAG TPA: hypothetical protein VKD90_14460, partial [Gemmataceae bacterium]|nr:hypothetical protein [Gemmataceae bacterium]
MTKIALRVEACEDRVVPSATIDTGYEAYSWVLINTLRADPAGFADRLQGLVNGTVPGAFGFGKGDPVIADLRGLVNRALSPANYGASLALMRSTPPAGPFAWDEVLAFGANAHTRWMKANGFAHTGTTGGRVTIPGFDRNDSAPPDEWGYGYPTFNAWGEDIAWAVGAARNIKAAYVNGSLGMAGLRQREAFLDTVAYLLELNSSSLGHLQSLLARDDGSGGGLPAFNAIGIDTDLYQAPAAYEAQDGVPEAWVSTHRLGLSRPGGSGGYVAGVAFQDDNGNGFYDVGEGAELTVDIRNPTGAGVTITTDEQGAFSEYLPNGTYTVRFSSNGRLLDSQAIAINNTNAWADLAFGRAALSSPTPAARVAAAPAASDSIDLAEPTVTNPSGTRGTLRPTATWTGVDGATGFQVRVDDLTGGATDLFPGVIVYKQDWAPAADLVSGRTYRFWVRAVRGDEAGPWGNPSDVTVDRPAPTGPENGTTSVRPTFTWSAIGGATAYEVRLNDVSAGVPALYVQRVGGTA